MDTGVVLVDQGAAPPSHTAVVLLPGHRRKIVDASRAAGFDVRLYLTWFSSGGELGSASELDRFRRIH
jgi:hypothetical protein